MHNGPSASARRRPLWRRWFVLVLCALLLVVLAYFFALPQLLRGRVEQALSAALKTPVSVGFLTWHTAAGQISAGNVRIGTPPDDLFATRVRIDTDVDRLLKRELVVRRVSIDGLEGTVRIDPQYQMSLAGIQTTGGGAAPSLDIDQVIVTSGKMIVRYPVGGASRDVELQIDRLLASHIESDAQRGLRMQAEIAGQIAGAKLQGDLKIDNSADPRVALNLDVKSLQVNRQTFDLPTLLQAVDGKVTARLSYEAGRRAPQGRAHVAIDLVPLRIAGASGTELKARKLTLPKLQLDFGNQRADLGAISLDRPELVVRIAETGLITPFDSSGDGSSRWRLTTGQIQAHSATVSLRRGQGGLGWKLRDFRWDGFAPGQAKSLSGSATADSGGALGISGDLGLDPLRVELNAELEELNLPPLLQFLGGTPLELSRGVADGVVRLQYRDSWRTSGKLRISNLATVPPDPKHPKQVMAVHAAEVDFTFQPDGQPWLDIASMKLDYPYLLMERHASGIFPYDLPAASQTGSGASPAIRLRHVEMSGGKVELIDTTNEPEFWTSLTGMTLRAADTRLPDLRIGSFEVSGKQDELSPAVLAGAVSQEGLSGRMQIDNMLLASMNPYISTLLGYRAKAGLVSLDGSASPQPPLLLTNTRMTLRNVSVEQTGVDFIQRESGVPLPVALNLLKNLSGEISLNLPVNVDTSSRAVTVGTIVRDAIRTAILGAITTPLRLLGNLFGRNQAPHAFAIDPVPFAAGSGALDSTGRQRVEEIARIIRAHPGLQVVIMPQISAADVDKVGAAGAVSLAEKRSAAVRDALALSDGEAIREKRLMVVKWEPKMADKATNQPSVYIELQAH